MSALEFTNYIPVTIDADGEPLKLLVKWLHVRELVDLERRIKDNPKTADESIAYFEWMERQLAHVKVVSGQIQDISASTPEKVAWVEEGPQLLRVFAGRMGVLAGVVAGLYAANRVSVQQRRDLPPLPGISRTSPEAASTTSGDVPAPTAASAEPPASASPVDATAPSDGTSSGTTDRSS